MKRTQTQWWLAAVFMLWTVPAQAADYSQFDELREGRDYEELVRDEAPSSTLLAKDNEIEVAVIFSYSCPHCYTFEQNYMQTLQRQLGKVQGARLVNMPVVWSKDTTFEAHLYWALVTTGQERKGSRAVFNGMHEQRYRLVDIYQAQEFLMASGLDYPKIVRAYNGFKVRNHVSRSKQLTGKWRVNGTPAIVVDGRYLIKASRTIGHTDMVAITMTLVREIAARRAERTG